jgi:hypothetical protein
MSCPLDNGSCHFELFNEEEEIVLRLMRLHKKMKILSMILKPHPTIMYIFLLMSKKGGFILMRLKVTLRSTPLILLGNRD